ncbi:aromatic-ring-hydroxylating dioxygenase subunit beta [Nocardia sp. R7R-8]|uniref:aromatic-ring-hydroxylating dioxygenase subunit beta n=1 Tax=Nocardia sp. R7R-8 TaxID=3459304 RepID=UPI00403D68F4
MSETVNSVVPRGGDVAVDVAVREQVLHLLHQACAMLDERRYRDWIELFAPDGRYVAISAENFENSWPLSVIDDNRASMLDRAEFIEKYWSIEPGRTRRIVGNVEIEAAGPHRLEVRSAFVVYLTDPDGRVAIQATGTYRDELVHLDGWRFRRRTAVHDNDLLTRPVTYPF